MPGRNSWKSVIFSLEVSLEFCQELFVEAHIFWLWALGIEVGIWGHLMIIETPYLLLLSLAWPEWYWCHSHIGKNYLLNLFVTTWNLTMIFVAMWCWWPIHLANTALLNCSMYSMVGSTGGLVLYPFLIYWTSLLVFIMCNISVDGYGGRCLETKSSVKLDQVERYPIFIACRRVCLTRLRIVAWYHLFSSVFPWITVHWALWSLGTDVVVYEYHKD